MRVGVIAELMGDGIDPGVAARVREAEDVNKVLAEIKAVSEGYPLRGSLTVADAPGALEQPTRDIPAPGEVWVDAPLLDALGLRMGDTLLLGDAALRVAQSISGRVIRVTTPSSRWRA